MPHKAQAPVRRLPLPVLPNRAFDSPWEELAVPYDCLPAPDPASRLRWLYRAADVWKTGAKDIARAFDALARAFAQSSPHAGGRRRSSRALDRSRASTRRWDRLADLYEGMAEESDTAQSAAVLLMEVSTIRYEQKGHARPRRSCAGSSA